MNPNSEFAHLPCCGCRTSVRTGETYVVEQELGREGWTYQVWHSPCDRVGPDAPPVLTTSVEGRSLLD